MLHYSRRSYFVATGLAIALTLGGCTSPGAYVAYANAQVEIAKANSQSDQARFAAMRAIAETGDTTTKVTALMSIQAGGKGGQGGQGGATPLAAPAPEGQGLLQVAAVALPAAANIYAIGQQVKLGLRQSDNATSLGLGQSRDQAATNAATFGAFASVAGQIQAPAATVNTSNVTLTGAGVIGSGSYEIGPNSGAQSGNSGRLAGGSITDNTATPTVVRPEVVQQPAPLVVHPVVVQAEAVAAPGTAQP